MLLEGPHRRYNPLFREWVLCSPHRLERPWQGQRERAGEQPPEQHYDPTCYLCPGNQRAKGLSNPTYEGCYVFDNDFPAVTTGGPQASLADVRGLFVAHAEQGRCRVLCFSPRHDLTLARMGTASVRAVVEAWSQEVETLGADPEIAYVQVFENKGSLMGCSNPHPHGQIWAVSHVPSLAQRKHDSQLEYYRSHGSDLLGEVLDHEVSARERIVVENEHFVALVPFWAVWPYEVMVLPRRRVSRLPELSADERHALAELLPRLLTRYDNLFACSFAYSMGWHGAPTDGAAHPHWRLHASFLPPLLRSATVRKHLVGYELSAEPQRDLTAEEAARRLRAQSEVHYLEVPGGDGPRGAHDAAASGPLSGETR